MVPWLHCQLMTFLNDSPGWGGGRANLEYFLFSFNCSTLDPSATTPPPTKATAPFSFSSASGHLATTSTPTSSLTWRPTAPWRSSETIPSTPWSTTPSPQPLTGTWTLTAYAPNCSRESFFTISNQPFKSINSCEDLDSYRPWHIFFQYRLAVHLILP